MFVGWVGNKADLKLGPSEIRFGSLVRGAASSLDYKD